MAKLDEADLRDALTRYRQLRDSGLRAGNWTALTELFAPDATYRDADHGEFRGREAILAYMNRLMAPLADLRITDDWEIFDPPRGWIVTQSSYGLDRDSHTTTRNSTFQIWSRFICDADGLFELKEDMYNAHDAFFSLGRMIMSDE